MTFAEQIRELEMDIDFASAAMLKAGPSEQPYYEHTINLLRAQRDELQRGIVPTTTSDVRPGPAELRQAQDIVVCSNSETEDQERKKPMPAPSDQSRENYRSNLEGRIINGQAVPKCAKYQLGAERWKAAMAARAANGRETNGQPSPDETKRAALTEAPVATALPETRPETATVVTISGQPASDVAIDLTVKRAGESIAISGSSLFALRLAQITLNSLGAERKM